jgi:hypothetical protein
MDRRLAPAAAWLAFMTGLIAGREVGDPGSLAIGAAIGAAFVLVGFAAASRMRALSPDVRAHRARLAILSLAAGVALGLANLAANWWPSSVTP